MAEEKAINVIINYLSSLFEQLKAIVAHYLQLYVFSKNSELASKYGNFIVFMATLTVIYALIELIEGFKKFFRIIIVMGWALLVLLIAVNYFMNH